MRKGLMLDSRTCGAASHPQGCAQSSLAPCGLGTSSAAVVILAACRLRPVYWFKQVFMVMAHILEL